MSIEAWDGCGLVRAPVADDVGDLVRLLAVDPGEVHVGVSSWRDTACEWAAEWEHERTVDWFLDPGFPHGYERMVAEGFWLRPGQGALMQAGSTFPTVELIGVMRAACRRAGIPFKTVTPTDRKAARKRITARFAARELASYGHGDHALDAIAVAATASGWSVTEIKMPEPSGRIGRVGIRNTEES